MMKGNSKMFAYILFLPQPDAKMKLHNVFYLLATCRSVSFFVRRLFLPSFSTKIYILDLRHFSTRRYKLKVTLLCMAGFRRKNKPFVSLDMLCQIRTFVCIMLLFFGDPKLRPVLAKRIAADYWFLQCCIGFKENRWQILEFFLLEKLDAPWWKVANHGIYIFKYEGEP